MQFILVKDKGAVIGKECYEGDLEAITRTLLDNQSRHPSFVYEEVSEIAFNAEVISVVQSKNQKDWGLEKGKGIDQAISFIAKTLGLE